MTTIVWPSDTTSVIDAIRGVIGRRVYFYKVINNSECTVCELDPVTGHSTDSFCYECSGLYYIPTYSGVTLSGHVTWAGADQLGWVTGGQILEGDCRVQIKYTEENDLLLDDTEWVEVDDRKLTIVKRLPRGVPTVNRILVDLKEKEK